MGPPAPPCTPSAVAFFFFERCGCCREDGGRGRGIADRFAGSSGGCMSFCGVRGAVPGTVFPKVLGGLCGLEVLWRRTLACR